MDNSTTAAVFMFDTIPAKETFIFKLVDPARIQEARDILSGKQKDKKSVGGLIITKPASYNPPWHYHLQPESMEFFQFATEVCDASISFVEEHLAEVGGAFLPGNRWCPWTSRLLKEIAPPETEY